MIPPIDTASLPALAAAHPGIVILVSVATCAVLLAVAVAWWREQGRHG